MMPDMKIIQSLRFQNIVYVQYETNPSKNDGVWSYALVKEVNESELTMLHDLAEQATQS